ncbi:hypothetical protein O181_017515 [Austropuccinia psidii MF-1]|uniref:Uncharacterized protein n=1 Tax=Austropuccinia psidii MF-1 TaxID=1389203 RepID=A0A9Q3C6X0_9BASI|nr:hypothetical protein [Austropuccinia psidii MF-1]
MSPVHLRNLGIPRNQPEDREGFSRTRGPGGGHLEHSGRWQDTEGNHTHSAIPFQIQQKSQARGLEGYGSSSSAPTTPQRSFPTEHEHQEFQPSIPLGRTLRKFPEDISQRDTLQRHYGNHQRLEPHQTFQTLGGEGNQEKGESSHYTSYRRTAGPYRSYSDSFRLTRSRPNQLSSGLTPFRLQQISGQESPFFTISGSFQEKRRIQGKKQDLFQPKAERTEHNVVTPQSNLNSDKLWLQTSQFAVQTQEQLDYFKRLNERLQRNAILQEDTVKAIQESCAQLIKASEETNKRLNQVFEEQHHCKRDRDFLDQDINKLFNLYKNMKPQPQGHALDDPYHQEDIKPDSLLGNMAKSPSQYQDGDNMSYSEKEALTQLTEVSRWLNFSVTAEYDDMELIYYIYGLLIDVPSIPDYWIAARLNPEFKGNASIWYTEMKETHGRNLWP